MGAILEDLLTRVNHNRVRSKNLAMKNASRTGEQADMLPYVMQLPVTDGVVKKAYTKTPLEPLINGDGWFLSYLKRFGYEESEECPWCGSGRCEIAEHVLFSCDKYASERRTLATD
ncbi:GM13003 [Drosophila sechellia]|uniref:GM13003 n=1 Tax=Drosophila sechellia TaxID=7238 RepID=B4IN63_DROSE|nr:GM13003 [Drosophila sechellia]